MQMVIQQTSNEPVQVFLRGIISEDDAQILLRESQKLLDENPQAVWVHLEHIHQLADNIFDVIRHIFAMFHQAQISLVLIAHQLELFQRLIAEGIPAKLHTPDPMLQNTQVM